MRLNSRTSTSPSCPSACPLPNYSSADSVQYDPSVRDFRKLYGTSGERESTGVAWLLGPNLKNDRTAQRQRHHYGHRREKIVPLAHIYLKEMYHLTARRKRTDLRLAGTRTEYTAVVLDMVPLFHVTAVHPKNQQNGLTLNNRYVLEPLHHRHLSGF